MPLSVLLASIMTYGTLAENYEFAAMKSTGISLQRAMRSLIILHFFMGIGSFFFANHVIPYGEFKYYNLRRNLAKLKPALAITEGIFNEIGEMNIKVSRKYGPDNRFLEDVIIHEKSQDGKNRIVIKAERGELKSASIDQQLQLVLFNGNRYEEVYTTKPREIRKLPHAKVSFKEYVMNIDLSQFNDVDLAEEKYKSTYRMQKVDELTESIDSLEKQFKESKRIYGKNFSTTSIQLNLKKFNPNEAIDSIMVTDSVYRQYANPLRFVGENNFMVQKEVLRFALSKNKGNQRNTEAKKRNYFLNQKRINLHKNTFYEKYTLGFGLFFLVSYWGFFRRHHSQRGVGTTYGFGHFNFLDLSLYRIVWQKCSRGQQHFTLSRELALHFNHYPFSALFYPTRIQGLGLVKQRPFDCLS